ncbi:MAG: cell division protein ZipA C-terminal FtsZ-binding domain-containing protein [Gammaproteobacteria bacterium]|jgi:cell division protein ZipA
MPELRWILLLIGLLVLAVIYVWGRRRSAAREDEPQPVSRVEPRLDGDLPPWEAENVPVPEPEPEPIVVEPAPRRQLDTQLDLEGHRGADQSAEAEPAGSEQQKILVLHIRPVQGAEFHGPELIQAFGAEGLTYGDYGAFHHQDDAGRNLFTVVSMLEPGSFPVEQMEEFRTRGLTAFMMVRSAGSVEALARMIACARRLASLLDGEVLDEAGSTLTNQRATHMKEEIVEFLRQSRLTEGMGLSR